LFVGGGGTTKPAEDPVGVSKGQSRPDRGRSQRCWRKKDLTANNLGPVKSNLAKKIFEERMWKKLRLPHGGKRGENIEKETEGDIQLVRST